MITPSTISTIPKFSKVPRASCTVLSFRLKIDASIFSVYGILSFSINTPQLFCLPAKQRSLNQITIMLSASGKSSMRYIFSSSKISVTIFIHLTSATFNPPKHRYWSACYLISNFSDYFNTLSFKIA